MTPQARSPEWVRQTPQFHQAKEAMEAAQHAAQRATEVTDEASCARAAEILVQAKGAVKAIDKNREAAKAPYLASGRAIDSEFKELQGSLSGIVERLTTEVNTFEDNRRRAEEEAQRQHEREVAAHKKREEDAEAARVKAAKEAEAANQPPPPPPPPAPAPPPPPPPPPREHATRHTSSGSVSGRTEWKFEVVDPAMVPRKYQKIDEVQLGKDVRAGARKIPGVRIFPVTNTQARSK